MRRTMTLTALSILALFAILATARAQTPGPEAGGKGHEAPKPAAPSRLDVMKKLAGDWVQVGPDGKTSDQVVATYRVTAAGSAVEETLFAGSPHEMVTVYHMDGDDLVLTHYCVTGNQPHMKAEKQADPKRLVFHCTGGTNMKSENDEHMHQATLVFKDDDHLHSEWQDVKDGKNAFTATFDLARKRG